jgi:N-acetylmuramoyl-L-alanine amidase
MAIRKSIDEIIIHHSLTKDNSAVSWDAIKRWHVDHNGWDDIGYHFGIEFIESDYQILVGRMMDHVGAHCRNNNSRSIGVCLIGNFDRDEPPKAQWLLTVRLVASLKNIFNIPIQNIKGDREHHLSKTCPGRRFDMPKFRNAVNNFY